MSQNPGRVIVTKVRAHTTWADVRMGRVTAEDKVGNAWADKLAVAGAEEHAMSAKLQDNVRTKRNYMKKLHRTMVDILLERDEHVKQVPFFYDRRIEPPPCP